jgi:hypothetical protein
MCAGSKETIHGFILWEVRTELGGHDNKLNISVIMPRVIDYCGWGISKIFG